MIPTSPILASRITRRAQDAYRRVSEKPITIIFQDAKGLDAMTPQTVRLELDNVSSQSQAVAGAASRRKAVIFGVIGHPTQPDTIIRKGWRFTHDMRLWEVQSIVMQIGEIQATAETVN
jgi:hypothetical protein